jgi:hypothetical protein
MGTDCVETKSNKPSERRIVIPAEVVDCQSIFALASSREGLPRLAELVSAHR